TTMRVRLKYITHGSTSMRRHRRAGFLILLAVLVTFVAVSHADDAVPLKLSERYRVNLKDAVYEVRTKMESWNRSQTALIVCDVWDAHHCLNAVRRLEEMLPRMNQVLEKARNQGVLIIHAPSSCMEPYKDYPGRKLALAAPKAKNLPADVGVW